MVPDPIRVLQIVNGMQRAGLETMLMNYYRNIDRKKVQFDFLVHTNKECAYDQEIITLGGNIYHIRPMRISDFGSYLRELDDFFKQHCYQIVHSHLDALSGFALRAAANNNVPIRIAHSHNNGFEKDKKLILRLMAKNLIPHFATHYWGCSWDAARFMFGQNISALPSCGVLPNAIDLKAFFYSEKSRREIRQELCVENMLVLGNIGRFCYQKNHEFLMKIFQQVHIARPESVLLLIGEGEYEDRIRRQIERLGLTDSVRLLGVRKDIPKLLSAMDVFVLPSRFEGLGIVLLEAQANGLSCFASDTVAKEVNATGRIKFLSLSSSAEQWARQIVASDISRYDKTELIKNAGYDIEEASLKLINMYRGLYDDDRQGQWEN